MDNKEYSLTDSQIAKHNIYKDDDSKFNPIDLKSVYLDLDDYLDSQILVFSEDEAPKEPNKNFRLSEIYKEDLTKKVTHVENVNKKYEILVDKAKPKEKKAKGSTKKSRSQKGLDYSSEEITEEYLKREAKRVNHRNLVIIEKAREVMINLLDNKELNADDIEADLKMLGNVEQMERINRCS